MRPGDLYGGVAPAHDARLFDAQSFGSEYLLVAGRAGRAGLATLKSDNGGNGISPARRDKGGTG
jgi:hypothetical protein